MYASVLYATGAHRLQPAKSKPRFRVATDGMRSITVVASAFLLLGGCTSQPAASDDVHIADIHGMALDPNIPSRLYVATHHGLFVAENDTKWSAVTTEPFDMMGFTMHAGDGRIMYASGHPGRVGQGWAVGVVKSVDAGRTWMTLALKNEVDFHAMAMEAGANGAADTVYGFHGGKVHVSTDGGATWSSDPVTFAIAALTVDPGTGDLLAATNKGLQRTGRGLEGEWTLVQDANTIGIAAADGALVAYFAATGLSSSRDDGNSWSSLNWTAPADDYPWGIAMTRDAETLYAGTARGTIHKTADGGVTWTKIR